jgi:uncharacterized protein (DUF302 family)/outer membrane murein-binding lipoprotein Lpp
MFKLPLITLFTATLLLAGCGNPESANAESKAVAEAAAAVKAGAEKVVVAAKTAAPAATDAPAVEMIKLPENCEEIELDMLKCPLADDVEMDDAAESMKLRANFLNFKLVAHMPLSEQVKSMGGESKRMEIFQFCDASIAVKMVESNLAFAGFLPCRIAMVEGQDGKANLITLNMDKVLGQAELADNLRMMGLQVRNNIYNIVGAGATGDL